MTDRLAKTISLTAFFLALQLAALYLAAGAWGADFFTLS